LNYSLEQKITIFFVTKLECCHRSFYENDSVAPENIVTNNIYTLVDVY